MCHILDKWWALNKIPLQRKSQWLWCFYLATAHFADELMRQEQEQARLNEARKISVVNVNPTNIRPHSDTPEIRKYKKRFNSEILCAALWGESKLRLTFFLLYTQHLFLIESSINGFISLQIHYDLQIVLTLVFDRCRSEPAGRNRKWTHVTRSQRSGQSLQSDQPQALSTDGGSGGSQCPGHHIRWAHYQLSIWLDKDLFCLFCSFC